MELKDMTYGVVGLGIMGGSIAKAIRGNVLSVSGAAGRILACDINGASLEAARSAGVADEVFSGQDVAAMLPQCDLVYVCLYPRATAEFLKKNGALFRSGAIVTDISGVKSFLERELASGWRDDVDFVMGHPMAGGEREGYANSSGQYFAGRNYILLPRPSNRKASLETMRSLAAAMGFTRITETTCENHDSRIAFTSQLCHVIASALVSSAEDEQITAFGGGSFEDLTRIAMINAPLWTELFLSNRENLLEQITRFEANLGEIKRYIENDDAAALEKLLFDVREKRTRMGSIRTRA